MNCAYSKASRLRTVNIVQWFSDYILGDHQAAAGGDHPALKVDAIRYSYIRCAVSSKCVVICAIISRDSSRRTTGLGTLLLNRLESQEVVVYTYAMWWRSTASCPCALEVPRRSCTPALSLQSSRPRHIFEVFIRLQPCAPQLLLAKIGVQNSPERTVGNEFPIHCACAFLSPACWCLTNIFPSCCESYHHRELDSRRGVPFRESSSTSSAKSPQTQVTRTLINTSSKTYLVFWFIGATARTART